MKTKNPMNPMKNFSTFGRVTKSINMKRLMFALFVIIIILLSLILYLESTEGPSKKLDYSKIKNINPNFCKYCSGPSTHAVSLDSALIMIKAFQEDPNFRGLRTGGFYSWSAFNKLVDDFNKNHNSVNAIPTLVFYPGIDYRTFNSDVLFAGIEIKDCDFAWNPCRQEYLDPSPEIIRPDHHTAIDFFATNELSSRTNFEARLRKETPIKEPIKMNNMPELRGDFYGSYFSYYPSALFAFRPEFVLSPLSNFQIDPDHNSGENSGFRYYFGIDNLNTEHKLRILCCAVDSKGKIIVPDGNWDLAFRESSRPRRP